MIEKTASRGKKLDIFLGLILSLLIIFGIYSLKRAFMALAFLFNYYIPLSFYIVLPYLINALLIRFITNKDIIKGLKIGFILIFIFTVYFIYSVIFNFI